MFDDSEKALYNENDYVEWVRGHQGHSSRAVGWKEAPSKETPRTSSTHSALGLDFKAGIILGIGAGMIGFVLGTAERSGAGDSVLLASVLGVGGFAVGLLWRILLAIVIGILVLGVLLAVAERFISTS